MGSGAVRSDRHALDLRGVRGSLSSAPRPLPSIEFDGVLVSLLRGARIIADPDPGPSISRDPDDDIFLRCALATQSVVVSGDADLLEQDGWSGVSVVSPRDFLVELEKL